jgi:uncharacterized OsmC-like protein
MPALPLPRLTAYTNGRTVRLLHARSYKDSTRPPSLAERQALVRARYKRRPATARIVKRARTGPADGRDPFHGAVVAENASDPSRPYGVEWRYGVDAAVGGLHDAPNPGELLCAALAACTDGSVRMIADLLRLRLDELEVEVSGDLDVRGTLGLDRSVPVGFERLAVSVRVRAAPATPRDRIDRLAGAAERACVVLDTLRRGVPVDITFDL